MLLSRKETDILKQGSLCGPGLWQAAQKGRFGMAFSDNLRKFLEKSVDSSRDFMNKAGAQAQIWGEMGRLKLEILQLRARAQSLTTKLGANVYELLVEKGEPMIGASSEGIEVLLGQLKVIEREIAEKEAAFRLAGGKDADLDGDGQPG
jgi:hypothetical protein